VSCIMAFVSDTSSARSKPQFAPRFPVIPLPRFAFPPSPRTHHVLFRAECVIYARRIIRKRTINHSSRLSRVTALRWSPPPFVFSTCTESYSFTRRVLRRGRKFQPRAREYIRIEWNRIDDYVEVKVNLLKCNQSKKNVETTKIFRYMNRCILNKFFKFL